MVTIYLSNPQEKETQSMYIQTTSTNYQATQLKVIAMGGMYVAQSVKELAKHMSCPALDFVSSQLQHSSPQT